MSRIRVILSCYIISVRVISRKKVKTKYWKKFFLTKNWNNYQKSTENRNCVDFLNSKSMYFQNRFYRKTRIHVLKMWKSRNLRVYWKITFKNNRDFRKISKLWVKRKRFSNSWLKTYFGKLLIKIELHFFKTWFLIST